MLFIAGLAKLSNSIKNGAESFSGNYVAVNIYQIPIQSSAEAISSHDDLLTLNNTSLSIEPDAIIIGLQEQQDKVPNEVMKFLASLENIWNKGSLKGKLASCFFVGKDSKVNKEVVLSLLTSLDERGMILASMQNKVNSSDGNGTGSAGALGNAKEIASSLSSITFDNSDDGAKSAQHYGEAIAQQANYYKKSKQRLSMTHTVHQSLHPAYPKRAPVTVISWIESDPSYSPVDFTHEKIIKDDFTTKEGGLADPSDISKIPKDVWKSRISHCGPIEYDADGYPRNPVGRTGMKGRGLLRKWGPNQAADIIVTRIKPGTQNKIQMVAIQRGDTKVWAIPGGKIEGGESVSQTLRREFTEEAGNVAPENQQKFQLLLDELFSTNGIEIYRGYVDDPRNTDQAWMETVAVHFHCTTELGNQLQPVAGDDAVSVQWLDVDESVADFANLYASHKMMVLNAASGLLYRLKVKEESEAASKLQHAFREHKKSTKHLEESNNVTVYSTNAGNDESSLMTDRISAATPTHPGDGKMHGDIIFTVEKDAAKTLQNAFRSARKARASDLTKRRATFSIGKDTFTTGVKKLHGKSFDSVESYIQYLKS